MPKPPLKEEFARIEGQLIETMIAGLHEWRSDLSYPESHSDMSACARGILKMFKVERRPLGLTNRDINEDPPVCVICKRPSHLDMMGVRVCGNEHAREFAESMLRANPQREPA